MAISKPANRIDVTEAEGKSVESFRIEYPDDDRDGGAVMVRFTDGTAVCIDFKPLLAVRPSFHQSEHQAIFRVYTRCHAVRLRAEL